MRATLLVCGLTVASTVSLASADPPIPVEPGQTVYIDLGDRLSGDLGPSGGAVFANFNSVEDTVLNVDVRARSLWPTIELLDLQGNGIDLGGALIEEFGRARIVDFDLPATGNYTLVIETAADGLMVGHNGSAISADSGPPGRLTVTTSGDLPPGVFLTTLAGTVTNDWTGDPIPGAEVWVGPFLLVTNVDGEYGGDLPLDVYNVTAGATYFNDHTELLLLINATILDIALEPVAPVIVNVSTGGDAVPGGTVTATAEVIVLDGSMITDYHWAQVEGVPAMISGAATPMVTVDLASSGDYKAQLLEILAEPPIGEEQLPPNVPVPPEPFPGGLQDRFEIPGASPFSLEETGLVGLEVEVTTTSGAYHDEVEVHTHLPWQMSSGVNNVPIGIPVLLHGKDQASYDWVLNPPPGSTAVLIDGATQNPEFTPDIPGLYELLVTDMNAGGTVTLEIYAGTWRGVIVGQDMNGRPLAEPACVSCHQAAGADKFTPWAQTGHAEIFTNNLNTSTHYGTGCFPCHTVGFDPAVDNRGFDDAPDYEAFLNSGLLNNPGDNWTMMLAMFPAAAQLANIQCENCHGPQQAGQGVGNPAHMSDEARITLSSMGCGTCHGEPLRHGRFQQWQLSAHANYELAIDEGDSGNCSRCHTANGFLTWLPVLTGQVPGDPTANITVTWEPDDVHPQTCATCHDPHAIGTTTGSSTNATVRISGDTPRLIAGFTAYGVGRGAVCMTCHNSRRGLRNDSNFNEVYQTSEAARAPHGSAQADMIMGQNAYLVTVGIRGGHSFATDTCAGCHMVETPPPSALSYNQGGTNHTFFASIDICANCHGGAVNGEFVQEGVHSAMDHLQGLIEEGLFLLIEEQTGLGNAIDLNGERLITDPTEITEIVFGETRGRQSMTVMLTSGETLGPYRMNDVDVLDPGGAVLGEFYDFAEPELIKSGWNWNLVHNDGSVGVHNPTYVFTVLEAAIVALEGGDTTFEWPEWLEEWKFLGED